MFSQFFCPFLAHSFVEFHLPQFCPSFFLFFFFLHFFFLFIVSHFSLSSHFYILPLYHLCTPCCHQPLLSPPPLPSPLPLPPIATADPPIYKLFPLQPPPTTTTIAIAAIVDLHYHPLPPPQPSQPSQTSTTTHCHHHTFFPLFWCSNFFKV